MDSKTYNKDLRKACVEASTSESSMTAPLAATIQPSSSSPSTRATATRDTCSRRQTWRTSAATATAS